MSALDYIGIRGIAPDNLEIFQGIGGGVGALGSGTSGEPLSISLTQPGWTPYDNSYAVNERLWQAQNTAIEKQTAYLEALKEEFGEQAKNDHSTILGVAVWLSKYLGGLVLEHTLSEYIEKQFVVLDLLGEWGDDFADWIAATIVESSIWLIDFFIAKGDPNYQKCESMIAENAELLQLPLSYENYAFRKETLTAHQTEINEIEQELKQADSALFDIVKFVVDIIMAFYGKDGSGEEVLPDEWDDVIAGFSTQYENLDEWMGSVYTADAENTPMPVSPNLPTLPDKAKLDRKRALMIVVAKYGFKLMTEIIRKQKERDDEAGEAVATVKTALDTIQATLDAKLSDLAYQDIEIDFNGVKAHIKGQILEYS